MLVGVDVGGTFTDVVAISSGKITTVKIPTDVHNTELSVLKGAAEIGVENATVFNHASTHGLNAVLTRKLPKIGFLTTDGHRDMLDGGRTWRPHQDLTNPHWRRSFGDASKPIVPRYLRRGIRERIAADGSILFPLDETQARKQIAVLRECNVEGIAICLINAYVHQSHERRLRELVKEELGDLPCSISSDVSPLAKEFPRASTTVIDVCMKIIYGAYTDRLSVGLQSLGFAGVLNYANCAAQLLESNVAMQRPFEIVFAGPAAGAVASAHFGTLIKSGNMLCADIGGTTCDISMVSNYKPLINTTFELEHDLVVNALSNQVVSIAAGGGSLVTISQAGELLVGPGSAGANPGPACYGKGGKNPTTTDTCLLIGIIDPDGFAGGTMPLDKSLALEAFGALDSRLSIEDRIQYAFNVGVNNVAEGIANVAISHGVDLRSYSLVAFGAAGPMLLPATLELLKAAEVIVPPHPGLFSALGLVSSQQIYADSRTAYLTLTPDAAPTINAIYLEMEAMMRERFKLPEGEMTFIRAFDARLLGQSWETPFVPVPPDTIDEAAIQSMIDNFHDVYEVRSGNRFVALPVQGVTYRLEFRMPTAKVTYPVCPERVSGDPEILRLIELSYLYEQSIIVPEYDRTTLCQGDTIEGPAIIREALSTTFMLAGQIMTVGKYGELHICLKTL